MRAPVERNRSQLPCSFVTDAATLLRRLFNNPHYSDMDLSVDDVTFHIHRGILAEHCSYFREYFTNARGQDPTSEHRHLDCSYTPIVFERVRTFPIAYADSGDDSIRQKVRSLQVLPRFGRDDRDVLDSKNEKDRFHFAGVGDGSPNCCGHDLLSPSRIAGELRHQPRPCPPRDGCNETRLRADVLPSFGYKIDPHKANLQSPTPPKSNPSTSTTTDEKLITSRTSSQILYDLLHPAHLHEDDLLAVFRIAHIYGVPGLVNFLGDRIWDALEMTIETWPCLLRFSERFQLEDIKRQALRHASETRELWPVALESLGLDDFKVFLRGIRQPDDRRKASSAGVQGLREDSQLLKDDLLMMFLLVHYQNSSSFKECGSFPLYHDDDGDSRNNNCNHHRGAAAKERRLSSIYRRDSVRVIIQQQLQQRPLMTSPPSFHLPRQHNSSNTTTDSNKSATIGSTQQLASMIEPIALELTASPSPPPSLRRLSRHQQSQTTKVDRAKMWMTRFKHECGWVSQGSLLD
ncbi:hypothetical protein EC991_007723 [Linnemannia zychae]|nr:hypothetical protein EC991_007723 [Linnemannia zychae]